jgi:hypothetical protein
MLKKLALALAGIGLFAAGCWAAGETVATFGIASGTNPRNVCVFDLSPSRPCVTLGALDSTAHTLTIPATSIGPGLLLVGGTSAGTNTVTLTASGFTGANGQAISFIAGGTNTGAATINPSGTGALPVVRNTVSGPVALTGGELLATNEYIVVDYGGVFYLLNPTLVPGAASATASFSANKNGSNQSLTQNTLTKVTFGTAVFNIGGFYSTVNNRWTPAAGRVSLNVNIQTQATWPTVGVTGFSVMLYKNGTPFYEDDRNFSINTAGPYSFNSNFTVTDQCNGTDYYEVFINNIGASPSVLANASGSGGTWAATAGTSFSGSEL